MNSRVACLGEILLRLSAPDHQRLSQCNHLEIQIGGAEANVAVSLAQLGTPSRMISVLPSHGLGQAAVQALRRHQVDVSAVCFHPGRMGLYFLETGAMRRAAEVLYDRADSAFALTTANDIDWTRALSDCSRLHLSGVTPAIGRTSAELALHAIAQARSHGVKISFDGNFRARLWERWCPSPAQWLRPLMASADLLFANHRDIGLVLEKEFDGDDPHLAFFTAASAAFDAFPDLQCMAATVRTIAGVDRQGLAALMMTRDGRRIEAPGYALDGIVDRIGAGDAFAAALIHARHSAFEAEDALHFALAAACLKHSIPGDFNLADESDVRLWMQETRADVRR